MLKMVIEFDGEKIKQGNPTALNDMYGLLDNAFEKRNLKVCGNGVYTDNGNEEDLFQFMVLAGILSKKEWFVKFIKKWLWYEESDVSQDLIKTFEIAR